MSPQRLGQNFLADESWRQRIVGAVLGDARPDKGGVWIEIGAGHGEMTGHLAKSAERLVAIELDTRLLPQLRQRTAQLGNVTVVPGDVLALDFAALAGAGGFRVYGNLPYYITSPIVHHLLECAGLVEAFLVVQLEVAERMIAPPGTRERGYFSAFVQFHASAEILLRIPPGAFRPRPKVTSALVALRPPGEHANLGIAAGAGFLNLLKISFAQKRKTLRNNLRALVAAERAAEILAQAGIRPGARAEQLSLAEFARLHAAVRLEPEKARQPL